MEASFDKAVAFVLSQEGVYSNHPNDPGGETKWGISRRNNPEIPEKTWRGFTVVDAKAVYRRKYWAPCGCDNLPYPMDCLVFDAAVQHGLRDAMRFLVQASGPEDFIMLRVEYYTGLRKTWSSFGRGWMNRMVALYKEFARNAGRPVEDNAV